MEGMQMTEETAAARAKREKAEAAELEAQQKAAGDAILAHSALVASIVGVAGEIGEVQKNGRNTHFNYTYATKDDIIRHVKPLLAQHGLAIIPHHLDTEDDGKIMTVRWHMHVVHVTGAMMVVPWSSQAQDTQDKGFSKAATSAMKTFYMHLFDIASGDEADDIEHDAGGAEERTSSPRSSGGRVTVKQLLDYKAEHNISSAGYDWVITKPQVGAKAGTMLKDLPKEKLPAVMAGFEFYVNERDNRRDPETGEPLSGAPASDGDPQASYDDPGPAIGGSGSPDDDIPFAPNFI